MIDDLTRHWYQKNRLFHNKLKPQNATVPVHCFHRPRFHKYFPHFSGAAYSRSNFELVHFYLVNGYLSSDWI